MATPRRIPATLSEIQQHAPGLFTLILKPEGAVPRFKAGQFLHLAIDPYDPTSQWPESRVFSIASSPSRPETIRLTYIVKGQYTDRMARELTPGARVWLKFPYGSFFIEADPARETVLGAGGTGVTPFISFLEKSCDEQTAAPIRLFYGLRNLGLLTYQDCIEECLARLSGFRYQLFLEEIESGSAYLPEPVAGRLSVDAVQSRLDAPADAVYYLSGPLAMIRVLRDGLRERGIPPDRIRVDDWE